MKTKSIFYTLLIFIILSFAGCGGSSNTSTDKNNLPKKSLTEWEITKDNRYQTYSSIVAGFDTADMFHFEKLSEIDINNSCVSIDEQTIKLDNCRFIDDNDVLYFSGSLKNIGSKDGNITEYDISNFTIKTEGVGEVKFSSAKIFFNIKYRDSYYKDASLVATDINGNRVEWDNLTLYRNSDGSKTVNGKISTSITNNLWLNVDSPTNLYFINHNTKGEFLIKGKNNSSMKLNFLGDGNVEIYVNSKLIETIPQDDLDDIYDKRDEYLKSSQ